MRLSIHDLFARISPIFRRKRMARFVELFQPTKKTRILDVGGSINTWTVVPIESEVTVLNIYPIQPPESANGPRITTVVGDGCDIQYPSDSFDIVFSNSVIEHLGTFERQQKFAQECSRLAPRLWIQTPAKSFFIEPHLLTPFVHFLPRGVQRKLLRNFTTWGLLERPDPVQVEQFLDEVRLLTLSEFQLLFPECEMLPERVAGFVKSYVAVRTESEPKAA